MQRRYNLAHLILAGVVVLGLTPLMVDVDAQAQIAFMSERDGSAEIYVMDADGENQRNLTINDTHDNHPSWSPNGKHIAFDSFANEVGGNRDIYVMDADGKNQRNLTNHPDSDYSPSWSPDSKRIAFVSNRTRDLNPDIYVMDADGANPRNLTNHPEDEGAPAWYNSVLSWSPDGKRSLGTALQIDR